MFIKFVSLLKSKKYQVSRTVSNCKHDWQEKWLIFLFRVINDLYVVNAVKLGSQRAKKTEKRSRAIRMLYVFHDDTRIYCKTTMMYDTLLQKRATRRFFAITDSTRSFHLLHSITQAIYLYEYKLKYAVFTSLVFIFSITITRINND